MARGFTGIPVDNGDGSFTFETEAGEPLVLRGESAERAFRSAQGAAPPAEPLPSTAELEEAAMSAPDERTAALDKAQVQGLLSGAGGGPRVAPPSLADVAAANEASFRGAERTAGLADRAAAQGVKPDVLSSLAMPAGSDKAAAGLAKTAAQANANMEAAERSAASQKARGGGPGGGAIFYEPRPAARPQATGGGMAAPSGPVPIQQTVQGTMPMSTADQLELKRAAQGRYEAAEGVTEVQGQMAREVAEVRAEQVAENRRAEVKMQAREQERARVIQEKLARVDSMAQEAAAGRIKGYWEDKEAETKFATAIFAALGAMAGGPNHALAMLHDSMDREERLQEKNLENKRHALQAEVNMLGHLRQEFSDREAASHAWKAQRLATAGAQLEEINARNLPAQQKAALQEFASTLNAEYTNHMKTAAQLSFSRTERFGGMGGGPAGPNKRVLDETKDLAKTLDSSKIAEGQADIEALNQLTNKYAGQDDIPGYGYGPDVAEKIPFGRRVFLTEEGRANRGVIERGKLAFQHAITGAGASEAERDRIDKAFEGAKTPAELRAAVRTATQVLANRRRNLEAGYSDEAKELYRERGGFIPDQGTKVRPRLP